MVEKNQLFYLQRPMKHAIYLGIISPCRYTCNCLSHNSAPFFCRLLVPIPLSKENLDKGLDL